MTFDEVLEQANLPPRNNYHIFWQNLKGERGYYHSCETEEEAKRFASGLKYSASVYNRQGQALFEEPYESLCNERST